MAYKDKVRQKQYPKDWVRQKRYRIGQKLRLDGVDIQITEEHTSSQIDADGNPIYEE